MNVFDDLDPEKLIASVKPRPVLYDRYDELFHRHRLKKGIWFEICEELNRNFSRLSQLQKVEYSREIQKRWKNLRTCFTRELCLQKREQLARDNNMPVKKRKRYEYYEHLLFLKDCVDGVEEDNDGDKGNEKESANSSEEVPVDDIESRNEDLTSDTLVNRMVNANGDKDSQKEEEASYKEDDDRQFLLSLVPMFKELGHAKKLEARIDVLQVFQHLTIGDDLT